MGGQSTTTDYGGQDFLSPVVLQKFDAEGNAEGYPSPIVVYSGSTHYLENSVGWYSSNPQVIELDSGLAAVTYNSTDRGGVIQTRLVDLETGQTRGWWPYRFEC